MADKTVALSANGVPGRGTIVVLNRDLMFGSRIRSTVRALGFEPLFTRDTGAFIERVRQLQPPAVLAILDMNGQVDWTLIGQLTAEPDLETPLLGFGPHVDVDNRRAAKAAGLVRIVSNGQFHADTAVLIERYARTPPADASVT